MPITFLSSSPTARQTRARQTNSVLFLDCPPDRRAGVERELGTADLKVIWTDSPAAVIAELRQRDLPVLVGFSRGIAALKFVTDLRSHNAAIPIFAVIEPGQASLATEAVLAGVADVLTSDVSGTRLAAAIAREAGGSGAAAARATGPHDFYRHSAAMRDACEAMTRVPATRAGVLIRGEQGTGRQMAARALHAAAGGERPGEFVAVDCAAFEPQQLEYELFGISARADEDALPARGLERISRAGRLHAALGGTLYLQNVPDMSTRIQRRLARVLRDREVVVDDGTPVTFDVRCITSGDDTLAAAAQDGRVEESLYRRLSAGRLELPPLRNRREDIPALANRFLRDACVAQQVPLKMFSRSALALLTALPWRGNATELKELLELILSRSTHRGIGVEDLLQHVRLDTGAVTLSQGGTLRQARTRFEHEYIATVLRQHRGRITPAAKALGIQRTNLYRKMRTLKVAQPRVR
jgi:DNA-binding NtrC family response regulator